MIQIINPAPAVNGIILATAVATTSGTAIDFVGIPATAKRITVMMQGVVLSTGDRHAVQVGAGSIATTGYLETNPFITTTPAIGVFANSSRFIFCTNLGGTPPLTAVMVLNRMSGNTWLQTSIGRAYATVINISAGEITLAGALDRVRITSSFGVDTFTAGLANISYE